MLIKRKWTNLCNRLVICCVYQKFNIRRCGGIGRHKGLKIPRERYRTGSSPVSGTIFQKHKINLVLFVFIALPYCKTLL